MADARVAAAKLSTQNASSETTQPLHPMTIDTTPVEQHPVSMPESQPPAMTMVMPTPHPYISSDIPPANRYGPPQGPPPV